MECKQKENEKHCSCPSKDCKRHGLCCECVKHHKEKGQLPFCLRF
jgi:hypothetical protein